MLVSLKWLQDYVDLSGISAKDLAEKITRSGIEVESVEIPGEHMKNVVIGHVLKCEKHPAADKLNKCLVDIGEGEPVQIICGAPNVAAGQKVAVAKPGARLPGGIKIKKAKLRGEESNGMICSLQELGIEGKLVPKEFADGIFVFPDTTEVGADAIAALNLDDCILELGLTPNRSDCLSMLGVAYEVAAILDRDVKLPQPDYHESTEKASDYIKVTVEAKEDNPLYVAKVVKNVKIGPSPLWMQARLMAAGIRPHNNVVDITNYIMLEYGQPLHAFDYDRLGSKEILVRRAYAGEEMVTLDDVKRTLTPEHLVITNGSKPVALAGVMGGANSDVQQDTTTVLIESAYFNGTTIRKASKDHALRSEASARYEKGVDPNRVKLAAERAVELLEKYAGAEVLRETVVAGDLEAEPKKITISLSKINRVLGTNLMHQDVVDIFRRLHFSAETSDDLFTVTVPTRRGDITIEEDLIEEVARLYGYDELPKTLPEGAAFPGGLTPYQRKRRVVRKFLEGAGLYQAITYSLTSRDMVHQFVLEKTEPIEIAMPMSEERSLLRQSLVPHLLEAISYNVARQNDSIGLYEIGSIFHKQNGQDLPQEDEHIAGAITGVWEANEWQGEQKLADFFVLKGILGGLFAKLGLGDAVEWKKAELPDMHPGRTAEIYLNGQKLGFIGQVHPQKQKQLDLKETYVFEFKASILLNEQSPELQYDPIPRFPSITRDIALVVDKDTEAGKLQQIIWEAGGKLLKEVRVFDLYEGKHLQPGKKSIAFSLKYYDPDKTLTDEEVMNVHEQVLAAVKEKTGAELRA